MSTAPHNHVLIDYENVQPELASRLALGFFKVWVFVGALQNKAKCDLVELLQSEGGDAKVIKMSGTGPNALDFHMAYQLGRLRLRKTIARFMAISRERPMPAILSK